MYPKKGNKNNGLSFNVHWVRTLTGAKASWVRTVHTPFRVCTFVPSMLARQTKGDSMTLRDFLRINFGWDVYDWQPGEIEF